MRWLVLVVSLLLAGCASEPTHGREWRQRGIELEVTDPTKLATVAAAARAALEEPELAEKLKSRVEVEAPEARRWRFVASKPGTGAFNDRVRRGPVHHSDPTWDGPAAPTAVVATRARELPPATLFLDLSIVFLWPVAKEMESTAERAASMIDLEARLTAVIRVHVLRRLDVDAVREKKD